MCYGAILHSPVARPKLGNNAERCITLPKGRARFGFLRGWSQLRGPCLEIKVCLDHAGCLSLGVGHRILLEATEIPGEGRESRGSCIEG